MGRAGSERAVEQAALRFGEHLGLRKQRGGVGGIIEAGENERRRKTHHGIHQQLRAGFAQPGHLHFHELLQRGAALVGEHPGIEDGAARVGESATGEKKFVEGGERLSEFGVGEVGELASELPPRHRHRRGRALFQTVGEAEQDGALHFGRVRKGTAEEDIHGERLVLDALREAASDAAGGERDFRASAERGELAGSGIAERDEAIPEQQREIVIGGVCGVLEEQAREVGAGLGRETLERRGEREAHGGRWVFLGEAEEVGGHGFQRAGVFGEKANGPDAEVLVRMREGFAQKGVARTADGPERPERAELVSHFALLLPHCEEGFARVLHFSAHGGALLEEPARLAHKPFIRRDLKLNEFKVAQFPEVGGPHRRFARADFVNPPAGPVDAFVFVTFAGVAPVGHEDATVRRGEEIDAAEPRVADGKEVRAVFGHVAAAVALEVLHVDAAAVEIDREKSVAIFLRPRAALVDEAALVRVPTAEGVRRFIHPARLVPFPAGVPMIVIGVLLDQAVGVRREFLAVHALVMRAGDQVPEVPDDGVREKRLAVPVPIQAPRVGGAGGDDFENLPRGMKAPDRAIHGDALVRRRAGFADPRRGLDAVASVEPAVRAPAEAVHEVVPHGAGVETVEQHDRFAVRDVVAVFVREKKELRRGQHPHAAEADLDAGEPLHLIRKDRALLGAAVVVRVFEDDDAVALPQIEADLGLAIRVVFRHPQPPARIRGHADGLLHLRLAGEKSHLETGRRFDRGEGLRRGHWFALLGVQRRGKIVGLSHREHGVKQRETRGARRPNGAGKRAGKWIRHGRAVVS